MVSAQATTLTTFGYEQATVDVEYLWRRGYRLMHREPAIDVDLPNPPA